MIDPKADWSQFKAAWIEALRSGRYRQAKRALRDTTLGYEGFCCLGVACDLIDPARWIPSAHEGYMGWGECAATRVDKHLGDRLGGLSEHQVQTLSIMNDAGGLKGTGVSFAEIADYIEAHVNP